MDSKMEVEDSDIELNDAKKNINYSDDGLPKKKEEKELEEEEDDEMDESFCDINTSQSSSQYHRNIGLSSYSMSSSINSSSFLTMNDMNGNIECCWNDINELRVNYLDDIKNKMNIFKNSLCLWNEGGFIPLFTNFVSWINEANIEINNLLNRLSSNTIYIQRFVKLYKKQQISLQNKTKQINDIEFENNTLKKENEWLRLELLNLTKTMSTISTSHQQIKYLNYKQNHKEKRLLEKLENIENDENDKYHQLEGVTIFNQNKSKENIKKINKNKNKNKLKTQQIKRSNSFQCLKSTNSIKNDNKSEKENKGKKIQKKVISYSRSFRHSKLKTLKSKINPNKGRRNSVNDININIIKESNRMDNIKENIPSTISKPKQRKSLSTLSAIKKPTASLRRLSYSNNANNQ